MINYSVSVNEDNSITFTLNSVSGDVVDFEYGNFLKVIPIGAGFSGRLGWGELTLMISPDSAGELISPRYEARSDRDELVAKIHASMEVYNG